MTEKGLSKEEKQAKRKAVRAERAKNQMQKAQQRAQQNPELQQSMQERKQELLDLHPRLAAMSEDELNAEIEKRHEEENKIRRQKLRSHMEALSDGVIAVIITIMLLEIPMPTGEEGYIGFLESVGIFLISFIVVANFWFNHHKSFAVTEEITEGIIVQDFVFIGLLSLVPLLTKWIMVQHDSFSSLNYGVVLILILIQQEWLNYSIMKDRCKKTPKTFKFWRKVWGMRVTFTIIANIIITLIAYATPLYGHWLFVVIPFFSFLYRILGNDEEEKLHPNDDGRSQGDLWKESLDYDD